MQNYKTKPLQDITFYSTFKPFSSYKSLKTFLAIGIILLFYTTQCFAVEDIKKADIKKQISYALGYDLFERLSKDFSLDPEYFGMGIKDSHNKLNKLSNEKTHKLLMSYQKLAREKQIERKSMASIENKKKGEKFLSKNKRKKGVITLPSGLQYKILKQGDGPLPKDTDTVECHYKGTFIDETEFDSSYKRGKPAIFQVTGIIAGWTEALQLMNVGSHWKLFIPSNLAYGERGAGAIIAPGSTLIFEVELISILD